MMKKLILLIFICSIFSLVTSTEPKETQVLKQTLYENKGCSTSDLEQDQHIVPEVCYQWDTRSKMYHLDPDSDYAFVILEIFDDKECKTLSNDKTSFGTGCNDYGSDESLKFVLETSTVDIIGFGTNSKDN
ncbi:hypothetical protein M0812_08986 [Anaeramoeba flamelloides]|uniref:Uncharacterized protein n=1 Tax=Anaeramoeba flamelloides TaxID=1746091 RepID=A0AAV7ZTG8_9EUKA|nr:hypothetical protein M0812_08986 [Anaeramoeba flamelloides]